MSFHNTVVLPPAGVFRRGGWRFGQTWRYGRPAPRYASQLGALILAYYAAAHLGYAFEFSGPVAAIVWLPVGVGIAFLYFGGLRLWPGVVIGDLLVNNYSTLPIGTALGQSFGNLLEVVVATVLIGRLCPREGPAATVRGVAGIVFAIACGTFLSATIGSLSSWLGGVISGHTVTYVWRTWWLGDLCGALIVLPLALSWSRLPAPPWPRARVLEAALMVIVVAALSATQLDHTTALSVLVFPALLWAAMSFGPRGATVAITIICAFAVWGATNNRGPFGVGSIDERLLETQLFIATVSLSALAIAAIVAERGRLAEGLRASRARLVEASDEARQLLERNLHDGAQQSLLGLQLRLSRAADVIPDDPVEGRRLIRTIERQVDGVLDDLRSLTHGVFPRLLRERGIVEALRSAVWLNPSDVSVHGAGLGRYPQPIEAAVYFCCLEALQNVVKHAGTAVHADVRLWQSGDSLCFEVIDSGAGFEPRATRRGSGLSNMQDRIDAVGGSLSVASRPGHGTTVSGQVPIR